MANEAKPSLDVDRLESALDALASQRRLCALAVLRRREAPLSVSDLADEVAVCESDASYDRISETTFAQVYTSLYHVHLPKLRDADVVDYDSEAETVSLSEDAVHVERIIDAVFE